MTRALRLAILAGSVFFLGWAIHAAEGVVPPKPEEPKKAEDPAKAENPPDAPAKPGEMKAPEVPYEDREPPKRVPPKALDAFKKGRSYLDLLKRESKGFFRNADEATTAFEEAVKLSRAGGAGTDQADILDFQILARYNLAIAYQMTMEFRKAQTVLDEMMRSRPTFYQAMVELGDVYAWQKNYPDALKWYTAALRVREDYFNPYLSRTILNMKARKFDDARKDADKGMALADANTGGILSKMGEKPYELSRGWLRRLVEAFEKKDAATIQGELTQAITNAMVQAQVAEKEEDRKGWKETYDRLLGWARLLQAKQADQAMTEIKAAYEAAPKLGVESGNDTLDHWVRMYRILKGFREIMNHDDKGPEWKTTYEKTTKHYIVKTDISQEMCDFLSDTAENIFTIYINAFKEEPRETKFPILVFGNLRDYFRYGGPPNTGGFYSPYLKKVVVNASRQGRDMREECRVTVQHECFHQFLDYFIENPPQWYNEGFADFFGGCEFISKKEGVRPCPNAPRLSTLRQAIGAGLTKSFSEIAMFVRAELYDPDPRVISANYAQSWSMIYFMMMARPEQNYPYRAILGNYYRALKGGRGALAAYQESFGKVDVRALEAEWKKFIQDLR
ncbi:MAG: DUF1570 domain-containing protein [Planctomycetota bacterium]